MKYTYFVIIFESSYRVQKIYENPTNNNVNKKKISKNKNRKNFPHKINFYGCMAVCMFVLFVFLYVGFGMPAACLH